MQQQKLRDVNFPLIKNKIRIVRTAPIYNVSSPAHGHHSQNVPLWMDLDLVQNENISVTQSKVSLGPTSKASIHTYSATGVH